MKKFFLAFTLVLAALVAPRAFAQAADPYELKTLDVFGSCKVGTVQEESAEIALSYLKAFITWHVGDQMVMMHPDFIGWHSSVAGLLAAVPAYRSAIPFTGGQYRKDNYVEWLTFLAYHNDIDQYEVVPTRVDCVGDNRVILMTEFTGLQLKRDETTGCVTHTAPFGSPTKITLELKDLPATATEPSRKMVYRAESYLDDTASVKVREELAKRVKSEPALKPVPSTCKTRKMIYDEFAAQVVQ